MNMKIKKIGVTLQTECHAEFFVLWEIAQIRPRRFAVFRYGKSSIGGQFGAALCRFL